MNKCLKSNAELLERWDKGPPGAEAFAVHAEIVTYLMEGTVRDDNNWRPLRRLLDAYTEGLEKAEQRCRYVYKHNEDRIDTSAPWEEMSEYGRGFKIGCEVCEGAIRDERESLHLLPDKAHPAEES